MSATGWLILSSPISKEHHTNTNQPDVHRNKRWLAATLVLQANSGNAGRESSDGRSATRERTEMHSWPSTHYKNHPYQNIQEKCEKKERREELDRWYRPPSYPTISLDMLCG